MAKESDYLRVTSVLYPFSGLGEVPEYILENAKERGTKVHEICTTVMDSIGMSAFEDKYEGYIRSFIKWKNGKSFIERLDRMYCDKYMITGEIDGIYKDKDELVLIDIKTPANEGKTWRSQGCAYAYLCKKEGYNISRIEFIQLSKNGEEAKVYKYEYDFNVFLDDLNMFRKYFKDMKKNQLILDYL